MGRFLRKGCEKGVMGKIIYIYVYIYMHGIVVHQGR